MHTKTLSIDVKNRRETSEGIKVDASISTESIDRDGEVIIAQGMNSTEYEANPILFFNHDYNDPIGNVVDIRRRKDKIDATLTFAQRPDDYPGEYRPQFVESLVAQGVVKGISIGFMPEPGGVRKASKEDREKYGDRVRQVYSKWKLMEVSVAPLPANATALISAIRKGAVDSAQVDRWVSTDSRRRVFVNMPKVPRLRLSNM